MITQPRLAAAGEPVASEGVSLDFPAVHSATPQTHTEDFSRLMSQASHPRAKEQTIHREQTAVAKSGSGLRAGGGKTSHARAQADSTTHLPATNLNVRRQDDSCERRPNAASQQENGDPSEDGNAEDDAGDTSDNSPSATTVAAPTTAGSLDPLLASTLLGMLTLTPRLPNDIRLAMAMPSLGANPGSDDKDLGARALEDAPGAAASTADDGVNAKDAGGNTGKMPIPKEMQVVGQGSQASPADISLTKAEKAKISEQSSLEALPVVEKESNTTIDGLILADGPNGTAVALERQRMKFAAENKAKTESTVQKLPSASVGNSVEVVTVAKTVTKVGSEVSGGKKDTFDADGMMDWTSKPAVSMTEQVIEIAKQPTDTAAQVERVSKLVNQEVVMIRQSGANNLAVSLKLDAHTELFLQLTHHDGQIQASLRCERGNVEGLDQHWGDLQESLAKQNVQLLPLENKATVRTNTFSPLPETASNSSFQQSSQNPQRQMREVSQDFVPTMMTGKIVSAKTTKTKTVSPQGWESWA